MTTRDAGWYWRRLRRMSVTEMARRAQDGIRRRRWANRQVRPGEMDGAAVPPGPRPRPGPRPLPPGTAARVPEAARRDLLAAADRLLDGTWEVLGAVRDDLVAPDWFLDPTSGRRAPQDTYAFAVEHRSAEVTGNVKQVWELSRHHHLTLLAAAWHVSGDDRYAERVDVHLRDWWRSNPNLSGIHWTSGIELGIRLVAWAWVRRLLDGWPGAPALFEDNDDAARQIAWHQQYLDAFRSSGTSANNHVIAEAAGQLVASCAFPWFPDSGRWRRRAAALLERELERNTFPSGVNRELASDYHGLVGELGLVAALEAEAAGRGLTPSTWSTLLRIADVAAALVDEGRRPPRQGDGDDGRALVLELRDERPWDPFLATAAGVFGAQRWWPDVPPGVAGTLLPALARPPAGLGARPDRRPSHFDDAGLTLLRTPPGERPEIWCRADAGPHGFLSIAAHAHADALSVEVRHGGVDVLADPGTYCYHDEPEWRAWFRSTVGHNTLELAGEDQSRSGGPFLWVHHATGRLVDLGFDPDLPNGPDAGPDAGPEVVSWTAEHDGYGRLGTPAVHRRTVRLDRALGGIEIEDRVSGTGTYPCRLAFQLGPQVVAELEGTTASLSWPGGSAVMELPARLGWRAYRGSTDPRAGWYSPRFGRKEPAVTLLGTGVWSPGAAPLVTMLRFGGPRQP